MADPTALSYDVLVLDGVIRETEQRMPNGDPLVSSPVAVTLIHGEHDAVLVDPPFTYDQIREVGDWVERSGRRLAYIYATHGHGDHWFGTGELLKRFPDAKAYATPGTINVMHYAAKTREQLWESFFPGQIPDTPVLAEPVPAEGLQLEGNLIQPVEVGHTDTDETTVLHVPSIGLVVAGDAAYNGVHQMLLESANGGLEAWLKALDAIEALEPKAVVASHKNRDLPDDPAVVGRTRQYLLDAARLLTSSANAGEYYEEMVRLYPDHLNRGPLWYSATALMGQ
ncbi:MBL fold metallo-hydrolase [Streptacidiphilus sp. PB12-B1b]|uniref:MBL fold metallo-hydrolase n=1 Tax=Streptacidiphilus sp. PB12-B1b TaxID=2705012 RepID=UPI0015F9A155|nr:MBL fold metallo-hydrolase [Streptacidiphilus sp. PB12-B1b]QMU77226.1 MBL fold metallo-hydrolase [Streptacidiphilus sp. PB12-B1b]